MNHLFKKSFALFSFLFLFILGLTFISVGKTEAAIVVDVKANNVANSLTVASGTQVTITWNAPTATFCANNFNSSTSITGSYTYTADYSTAPTKTFTVNCTASAPSVCSGTYINSSGATSSCNDFTTPGTCVWSTHCLWNAAKIQCGRSTCTIGCKNNPTYPNYSGISCNGSTITSCSNISYPAHPNCTWNP